MWECSAEADTLKTLVKTPPLPGTFPLDVEELLAVTVGAPGKGPAAPGGGCNWAI